MGRNQYDLDPEDTIVGAATVDAQAIVKRAGRMSVNLNQVLRHLAEGKQPRDWLTGRSQFGGWEQVESALQRRGLIRSSPTEVLITESGRAYLRALELLAKA